MMDGSDDSRENRAVIQPTLPVNTMKIPITHVARRAGSVLGAGYLCRDEENKRVADLVTQAPAEMQGSLTPSE